jgi:3',5'-cyclic AMP phosphodiesterase CpdA
VGSFTKIVWISDLHLTGAGMVHGFPCRARLEQMVAEINRRHSDAVCCIASGDLGDTGGDDEYSALREVTAGLAIPFLPMIGNHDNRANLMAAFPPPGEALAGFMQYRADFGNVTLLCLDTQLPGDDGGHLDDARLNWFRAALEDARDRQVLVFMHHPPGPLDLGILDEMPLYDPAPLMAILQGAPNVAYLFCGHVHRSVSGVIGGIPFSTLRSLVFQTKPPFEPWDWSDFIAPAEAPQYAVILAAQHRVVVQVHDLEGAA